MKKILALVGIILAIIIQPVYAQNELIITYDGSVISFDEQPVVLNNKTLVQIRPIAEAMGLGIDFNQETGQLSLSKGDDIVIFKLDSDICFANGTIKAMDVPMIAQNNYTFVPVRELAEPFGKTVLYDGETNTVDILSPKASEAEPQEADEDMKNADLFANSFSNIKGESVFFYQSQPELELPNEGRGYCWVCSYAMAFSNILKTVISPMEVAQYNIERGYEGNYMAGHLDLAGSYGLRLVPALDETSPYYAGFNIKNRGETVVLCEDDDAARNAIREALNSFPAGVIVRYDGYPHSMLAVGCDEEYIYFNDPGIQNGEYVTFKETCLKNFNICDISSIQAFEVK